MGAGQRGLLFSLKICLIDGGFGREGGCTSVRLLSLKLGSDRRADVTNVCFSGVW